MSYKAMSASNVTPETLKNGLLYPKPILSISMKKNFAKIAEADLKSHLEGILCIKQLRNLVNEISLSSYFLNEDA